MNPHLKNKVDIGVSDTLGYIRQISWIYSLSEQSLSEEEQKVFRLYGKLPNKKDLLQNKLKVSSKIPCARPMMLMLRINQERKYFDSGDYALSKAGKASEGGVTSIGSQHPLPENIPHLTSPGPTGGSNGNSNSASNGPIPGASSGSPVKESSFLQRETSVDEGSVLSPKNPDKGSAGGPPAKEGMPTRS